MQTKYQTSADKMDLESCLWQIFTILKLKPFGKTVQLQWVSLFPLFPAWHKQLTPNLLLPQLHNESSQWHPGKEIGWGIMGCHSNGLSIKKTLKNPQNTAPLWLSMRLNHLRSTLPLFLSFSTTALCASKPRNHRIHLPCPALRCNSLLSLFGQAEEEEGCPGRVWQLMLLLWGEINCKLDCAPSSEFSLIYRILPLFTHSKGSYNFKSLKPAILTPKHALTELPEGKVALEIFFDNVFLTAPVCRNKTIFTSFKIIHMSIFVSMPSNANHSAFKLCTNTDQALVTANTKKKKKKQIIL